jgi:hypothetical protein
MTTTQHTRENTELYKKDKVAPLHAIKTHHGHSDTSTLILSVAKK